MKLLLAKLNPAYHSIRFLLTGPTSPGPNMSCHMSLLITFNTLDSKDHGMIVFIELSFLPSLVAPGFLGWPLHTSLT